MSSVRQVHKLCHRWHMNHFREFYEEVLLIFPDYKRCNKWLKQNKELYQKKILEDTVSPHFADVILCIIGK